MSDSLAGQESKTYGNRVHCCLVVSPAGRPLHAYRSVRELSEALRDAIAGHRSLLEDSTGEGQSKQDQRNTKAKQCVAH
jgi:hypothetical protein